MTDTPDYVICLKCFTHNPPGEDFCKNCGAYLPFEGVPGEATTTPTDDALVANPAFGAAEPETPSVEREEAPDAAPGDPTASGSDRVAADGVAAPAPALRKPTAPAAPRPRGPAVPIPAEPAPAPDDVICPSCRTRNRPDRRFCRRCGTQLSSRTVTEGSTQPAAGSRPKGRSARFPFTAVIVLLVLIGTLVVAWLNRDIVIGFVQTIVGFVFSSQSP